MLRIKLIPYKLVQFADFQPQYTVIVQFSSILPYLNTFSALIFSVSISFESIQVISHILSAKPQKQNKTYSL